MKALLSFTPSVADRPDDLEDLFFRAGERFQPTVAWSTPPITHAMATAPVIPVANNGPQFSKELPPGFGPADPNSQPSGITAPDYLPVTTYRNWHLQAVRARQSLDSGFHWNKTKITFNFENIDDNVLDSDGAKNPAVFDEKTREATREILKQITEISGLTFVEKNDPNIAADIHFRRGDIIDRQVAGYAYLPRIQSTSVTIDNKVLVHNTNPALDLTSEGNFGYHVLMHEIGHALGLNHPFEDHDTSLPGADDTTNGTVMSYSASTTFSMGGEIASRGYRYERTTSGFKKIPDQKAPHSYQIYDILTLQAIYGPNLNTNQGNTNYVMNGKVDIRTINDRDPEGQNSVDTISVADTSFNGSGEVQHAYIDLESGGDRVSSYGDTHWWIAYDTWIENAIGGRGDDRIVGNDRNNFLDGGVGADLLAGSYGNDTYIVDDVDDVVFETSNEIYDPTNGKSLLDGAIRRYGGIDDVRSSVTFHLSDITENLTLTGGSDIDAYGSEIENILTGNSGDNLLDGGAKRDTMSGGLGNDTYVVDTLGESMTENQGEGIDEVQSFVSHTLGANFENLDLLGYNSINGTGNDLKNTILGNRGANQLDGLAGNDTMIGGAGNDTYGVDSKGDVVTESANGGIDWVVSSITYNLFSNTENLRLIGINDLIGRGTEGENILEGNLGRNLLFAYAGNDKLDGGFREDTMIGGTGNDTYFVDNTGDVIEEKTGEGIDQVNSTVTWRLRTNEETLLLLGTVSVNGFGNSQNNFIRGNLGSNILYGRGGNDTIIGGQNADTMIGGGGNDSYNADNVGDKVIEAANQGNDILFSTVSQVLSANVESLYLDGGLNLRGVGNTERNRIWGNRGNNFLDGRGAIDTMEGGLGNDTYIVNVAGDLVREASNSGTDLIRSQVTRVLEANVEHLDLLGIASTNGTGNHSNNRIRGNSGRNRLIGGAGNDTLIGGTGIDAMIGGTGNDVLEKREVGDVLVELAGQGNDTVLAYMNYTAGGNIENITLMGLNALIAIGNNQNNHLIGNFLDNRLEGRGGNDTLIGNDGSDTMIGGDGNDFYTTDSQSDQIIEQRGQGIDTVQSEYSYTLAPNLENLILLGDQPFYGNGNNADNKIYGNETGNQLSGFGGNDTLIGRNGADTLIGGSGDDELWVDTQLDVIREAVNGGDDTVVSLITWSLGNTLENLRLIGSNDIDGNGNRYRNLMIGNSGANFLNGGDAADTMRGAGGDDTYVVERASDVVVENAGEGTDQVNSSVSYAAGANVENISLVGLANLNAYGNSLNNYLTGNNGANLLLGYDGADTLDGGLGADVMRGGSGSDVYYVNNLYDSVQEFVGEGTDTIYASLNWTLQDHVENLVLTGSAPLSGTGNTSRNHIAGNDFNNYIDGRGDEDTMEGGLGNDTYVADVYTDSIIEIAGGGTDLVMANCFYTLSANLENLTLLGTGDFTATGNGLNNDILGNSGNNILNGGKGLDTLSGGAGDDTYRLKDEFVDIVVETYDSGSDTVITNLQRYQLTSHVENLVLEAPTDVALRDSQSGFGNDADNNITGTIYANYLEGGAGNDSITGDAGEDIIIGASKNGDGRGEIDTLVGGEDADIFVLGGHEHVYYDDNVASSNGYGDYALIKDYDPDPVNFDQLQLAGNASQYWIGVVPVGMPAGYGVYFDSDGSGVSAPNSTDELIAILQSNVALTTQNTLGLAKFV